MERILNRKTKSGVFTPTENPGPPRKYNPLIPWFTQEKNFLCIFFFLDLVVLTLIFFPRYSVNWYPPTKQRKNKPALHTVQSKTLQTADENLLDVFQRNCLRIVLGTRLTHRISNSSCTKNVVQSPFLGL